MKTVSGKLVSSKPTSISKAAKILSNFIATETGASEAVSAYLRRASAAFDELAELHRELKPSISNRKPKKPLPGTPHDETKSIPNRNAEEAEAAANHDDSLRKKDKKKKMAGDVQREDGGDLAVERGRKKRKSGDIDGDEVLNPAEEHSSKKSKKRRKVKGEN